MGEQNPKRHGMMRPFLMVVLAVAVLGVLGHFFFDSLPPTLQQHLDFLK